MQLLQFTGYSGEAMQIIEHAQPYGFDSFPLPPGGSSGSGGGDSGGGDAGGSSGGAGGLGGFLGVAAEHFTTMINSGRSHGVTMSVADSRYRLLMKVAGEVAKYDDQTHQSHITRAGHVRSIPNAKHHRHQVMKQSDSVTPGPMGFGQTPWAYDVQNGNQVRNSHSYRHHDANLTVKQHPTEHSKHIITGDAIPPDGQGKSNIKHKVQLHVQNGHTLAVFGQNDSNYRHSTIHDDKNGITSNTMLSRALTATKSISHSAGTTHSISAQQTISQTAGTTHTVSGQSIVHDGPTNLNGNTTIEQDLNVSQNIQTASLGLTSDKRLKTKPRPFENALELALKVPVYRYNQHHGKVHKGKIKRSRKSVSTFGVIAQDLLAILPELVGGKEILTVQETKLGLLALAALQKMHCEMRRENAELRAH